jgi:hypothetical protein
MSSRAIVLAASCVAVLAASIPSTAAAGTAGGDRGDDHGHGLVEVRKATARFHSVAAATRAGYEPAGPCAEEPGMGGMGFHYVNQRLVADPALRPTEPEAVLYELRHGRLHLVAVEYIRNDADQDLGTDEDRPWLFGRPFDGPMLGHEPGQPIHYDLHAWAWKANPAGTFAQWNPRVSCP